MNNDWLFLRLVDNDRRPDISQWDKFIQNSEHIIHIYFTNQTLRQTYGLPAEVEEW